MTPNQVISIAAAKLGDSGFVNIYREEYEVFLNNVAHDLWFESKAAHTIRQYALTEGERKITLPDRDIIAFHILQVRKSDSPAAVDAADVYDPNEAPTYIREKSPQQDIEEGPAYYQDIGATNALYHMTPELHNGVYTIHSSLPFAAGLVLQAYAYVTQPMLSWQLIPLAGTRRQQITPTEAEMLAASLDSNLVWDPFVNMFVTGITWRAAEQHRQYVKNNEIQTLYRDNKDLYFKHYLPKCVHFIHSLKDSTAGIQVRPFHYLEDGGNTRLY